MAVVPVSIPGKMKPKVQFVDGPTARPDKFAIACAPAPPSPPANLQTPTRHESLLEKKQEGRAKVGRKSNGSN